MSSDRPDRRTGQDEADCLYCMDEGTIKRRYGTVGPGPAKIVKRRPCPMCSEDEGTDRQVPREDASGGDQT